MVVAALPPLAAHHAAAILRVGRHLIQRYRGGTPFSPRRQLPPAAPTPTDVATTGAADASSRSREGRVTAGGTFVERSHSLHRPATTTTTTTTTATAATTATTALRFEDSLHFAERRLEFTVAALQLLEARKLLPVLFSQLGMHHRPHRRGHIRPDFRRDDFAHRPTSTAR